VSTLQSWRWTAALVVAVLTMIIAIGWLDVVRGRQLLIVEVRQQVVLEELERFRQRLDRLERGGRP
jgi:hypothetical protein